MTTFDTFSYLMGFIGWCFLLYVILTSIPFIRRLQFEFFYLSHFAFLLFIMFAVLHEPVFAAVLAVTLVLWGRDKYIQIKSYRQQVIAGNIETWPTGLMKMRFRKDLSKKHHAGQYVSVPVPHPFI